MKLAILNGSPRGNSANSTRIAHWVSEEAPIFSLNKLAQQKEILERITNYDVVLFIIPLYVDSMPSQVKSFFELMEKNRGMCENKGVCFIVHSGFPEAIHSYSLREYLEYLSDLLGMNYLGTLIMAGSESLQMAPDQFFHRKIPHFKSLYSSLEKGQKIEERTNRLLSPVEKHSKLSSILSSLNPFKNLYWYQRARQHDFKVNLRYRPY